MFKKIKKIFSKKTTLYVIALLFIAKFLGFIKNIFMAKYYGTGDIADAYQMAISIPTIILGLILYSYQAFTKGYYISEKDGKLRDYTSSFINIISFFLLIISTILFLFPKPIITLFAPGFNDIQSEYTLSFLRPIIIGTIFLALANILSEFLRCNDSFIKAQVAYLIINIIEISTIIIAQKSNYIWLAYGYLIANFVYFSILIVMSRKKQIQYDLFVIRREQVRKIAKTLMPIFFSGIITDLNSMIDKIFASNFETGTISNLSYSTNIKTVFLIIAAGYLMVLFPRISKQFADKKYEEFSKNINKGTKIITILYVIISLIVFIFSKIIVRIVYFRGEFNAESLAATTGCLRMYTIGLLGISLRDLFIKAIYCIGKNKTIIIISAGSVVINIFLNFILSDRLGYIGLPLATSLSVWAILPFLVVAYRKNMKKILTKEEGKK